MRLWPVGLSFVMFGLHVGAWSVVTLDARHRLGGSTVAFAIVTVVATLAGSLVAPWAGVMAERRGARPVLAVALVAWAAVQFAGAALVLTVGGFVAAALGVVVAGLFGGAVDVVMNVSATAGLAGRPGALVRFHGIFNLGGAVGGAVAGWLLSSGAAWPWVWVVGAVMALVVAVTVAVTPIPAGQVGEHQSVLAGFVAMRDARVVRLGVAFACVSAVEGGIGLWGVQYLRDELRSGVWAGAGAAVAGFVVAAAARIGLGGAVGRLGPRRGAVTGMVFAAAGVAGLAAARTVVPGTVALVASSAAVAVCWPLLMSFLAGRSERPGAVVGAATTCAYAGIVGGPVLVGLVADQWGVRGGLLALVILAVVACLLVLSTVVGRFRSAAPVPPGR